jgi:transcription factor IIIB 90 kDa subunit
MSCGTLVNDQVIVNEITYGETASGAAMVQGATVQDGQRTAQTNIKGLRRGGRSAEEIAESALRDGREEIDRLANALNITAVASTAHHLYSLARLHHFHRPRKENAAICLYIACRQQKESTTMLIDFAEQLRINVFDLGATYKQFLKAIGLEDQIEEIPLLEIEPLLLKYAKRLEFGTQVRQVANDAALVLSRMDRDWIKTGRQPAALCGASLILAARMNNFRRTVREVVYVVKAGEFTIHKRLDEFRRTKAGRMTVEQFRTYANRLKEQANPPILYEAALRESRRKQLALGYGEDEDELAALADAVVRTTSTQLQAPRLDKDGFVIPEPPANRTSEGTRGPDCAQDGEGDTEPTSGGENEDGNVKCGRKRKRKRNRREPREPPKPFNPEKEELLPPTTSVLPTNLLDDPDLENEITDVVASQVNDRDFDRVVTRAKDIARVERAKARAERDKSPVADDEIIAEDEFEDDPEVANCKLTPREAQIKEKIWVTQNWEWMKAEQEKILNAELQEAQGKRKKKKPAHANKRRKRGDGSVLDGGTPVNSPAEAAQRMLEQRAKKTVFSKHLNYEKLQAIYATSSKSTTTSETASDSGIVSRETSMAPSEIENSKPVIGGGKKKPLPSPATTQSQQRELDGRGTQNEPVDVSDDAPSSDGETDNEVEEIDDREHFAEDGNISYDEDTYGQDDFDEEEWFGEEV